KSMVRLAEHPHLFVHPLRFVSVRGQLAVVLDQPLRHHGRDEAGHGREPLQAPAAAISRHVRDPENLGRLARRERYVETIEGMEQAVAQRLDERLLASPALKESQRPVARLERRYRAESPGEKQPGAKSSAAGGGGTASPST